MLCLMESSFNYNRGGGLHDFHIESSFKNFRQHILLSFLVTTFICVVGNRPKDLNSPFSHSTMSCVLLQDRVIRLEISNHFSFLYDINLSLIILEKFEYTTLQLSSNSFSCSLWTRRSLISMRSLFNSGLYSSAHLCIISPFTSI